MCFLILKAFLQFEPTALFCSSLHILGIEYLHSQTPNCRKARKQHHLSWACQFIFSPLLFNRRCCFLFFEFESIFKATPAKFLTACYVTDNEGKTPTFPMLLKRNLYRLIPLESLSFLVGKNLHDTYSATCVLNKKRNPKVEKRYLQFLGTAFLLVLVIYFFSEH